MKNLLAQPLKIDNLTTVQIIRGEAKSNRIFSWWCVPINYRYMGWMYMCMMCSGGMNIANWVCRMVTVHWMVMVSFRSVLFLVHYSLSWCIFCVFPLLRRLSSKSSLHTPTNMILGNLKQSFKVHSIDFLLFLFSVPYNRERKNVWHITDITLRWNSWMSCPLIPHL